MGNLQFDGEFGDGHPFESCPAPARSLQGRAFF
jgi:hypothetical protein